MLDSSCTSGQSLRMANRVSRGPKDYLDAALEPRATAEELRKLALSEYCFVRLAVAQHSNTPPDVLEGLFPASIRSHAEAELVLALAANPSSPASVQRRAADETPTAVHWARGIELAHLTLQSQHVPTGRTRHYLGAPGEPSTVEFPPPAMLSIVHVAGGGYYLFYYDADGNLQTDTLHESLEAAQRQARFEFGVEPEEWLQP